MKTPIPKATYKDHKQQQQQQQEARIGVSETEMLLYKRRGNYVE